MDIKALLNFFFFFATELYSILLPLGIFQLIYGPTKGYLPQIADDYWRIINDNLVVQYRQYLLLEMMIMKVIQGNHILTLIKNCQSSIPHIRNCWSRNIWTGVISGTDSIISPTINYFYCLGKLEKTFMWVLPKTWKHSKVNITLNLI